MHHSFGSLAGSLLLAVAAAAEPMSRVAGNHVEVFTTGSPAYAHAALVALEQAHCYFEAMDFVTTDSDTPLRIVAFHSTEEYAAFRFHQNAFGHFFKGQTRSFIVLTDLQPAHREALLHEYTHSVVRQAGLTLPQWLNEGVADLYSSLTVNNGHAVVGLPLAGRLRTIGTYGLMPLTELFSSNSLASNAGNAALLYAESWAFTHMLCFHPAYSANFTRLLTSATKKMDTPAALEQIFGKNLSEIERDLQLYLSKLSDWHGTETPTSPQPFAGATQSLTVNEADAVLTGLLDDQPWTRSTSVHRQAE